ncbi:MAG: hypothetical protein M1826_006167 [Phylliscum demangeonii]|nr:MAG: hypothetical protein M1826_006167 [Phylliscum demangeonii]
MQFAHVAVAVSAAFAALFTTVYLTPQLAVRVEPTCVAAHLPHNFCGLFGVTKVGDDDTAALRAAADEARPSPTTTAPPTPTIPLAGPSPSSDGGWEPAGEEGSAVPVDAGPKTAVTAIPRPDTATATNQFVNDITAKVVLERLVVPTKSRTPAGLRPASQASTGKGVAASRKRRASDPGSWSVALRAAPDGGVGVARGQDQLLGAANWAPPPRLEGATPIAAPESAPDSPRVAQEAEARGQAKLLGDSIWASPLGLEGVTSIAGPGSAPDSPRVASQEAEGPLQPVVGMEEALPAPQGEPAVEGDSPAEPASQRAEPADDFPPAEGPAPEDPSSSPSGRGAESEVAASLANEVSAPLEVAPCEPRGSAASEDGSGSVAPPAERKWKPRKKGKPRGGWKVQMRKAKAAAEAASLAQGQAMASARALLDASSDTSHWAPAELLALAWFALDLGAVSLAGAATRRLCPPPASVDTFTRSGPDLIDATGARLWS